MKPPEDPVFGGSIRRLSVKETSGSQQKDGEIIFKSHSTKAKVEMNGLTVMLIALVALAGG